MSMTSPTVHLPVHDTIGSWLRRHLGWMLVAGAVAAAALLVTMIVLDGDSTSSTVREPSISVTDSINALDNQVTTRSGPESINALDHPATAQPAGRDATDRGRLGGVPIR